jgi:hypothetical protein
MDTNTMQLVFGEIPINELEYVRSAADRQRSKDVIILLSLTAICMAAVCFYLYGQNQKLRKRPSIIIRRA